MAWCLAITQLAWPVRADEWVIEPAITAGMRYDDNINLQTTHTTSAFSLNLAPEATASNKTESRELSARYRVNVNQYPGQSELNAVDHLATFSGTWTLERDAFGLNANFLRDSTLKTELDQTGVVQKRAQRTQVGAGPVWQHSLDETTKLRMDYQLSSVHYEKSAGLVDYKQNGGSIGLDKSLSENLVAGVTLRMSRFITDPNISESRTTALSASARWKYSERLAFDLEFGVDRTRSEQQTLECRIAGRVFSLSDCNFVLQVFRQNFFQEVRESTTNTGSNIDISSTYKDENSSWNMAFSRGLNPTGGGVLVRSDRLSLAYNHEFDERFGMSLYSAYIKSRYLDQNGSGVSYWTISPSGHWQIDRDLNLGFGFAHTQQSTYGVANAARSNEFFITLTNQRDPISISR